MNILTDEEIISVAYDNDTRAGPIPFARAIEVAVLEKVGKVDVEPDANKRKAERLVRMLTDGYSGMKAAREVIALLEQWPDSPASALAALRAENERLKTNCDLYFSDGVELRAQLEAAQADAARWDTFRKADSTLTLRLHNSRPDARDAAINAARAALEQKT